MMEHLDRPCIQCEASTRTVHGPMEIEYRDTTVVVPDVEYSVCDSCGLRTTMRAESRRVEQVAIELYQRGRGRLAPSEITKLRKLGGPTQDAFENRYGFPRKTLARWESGAVLPLAETDEQLRGIRKQLEWESAGGIGGYAQSVLESCPRMEQRVLVNRVSSGPRRRSEVSGDYALAA